MKKKKNALPAKTQTKAQRLDSLPFMHYRYLAMALSAAFMTISVLSFVLRGITWGLDFSGGTLVEVGYAQPAHLNNIRQLLVDNDYENAVVVHFGSDKDVLVRIPQTVENNDQLGSQLLAILRKDNAAVQLRRVEFVGPQVGAELREQGGLAILTALAFVMLYLAFRFQYKFAIGAVSALVHDVLITVGIFSLFGLDFDLTVLAALLAVIGYSLNDTIVVSDRIRENFRLHSRGAAIEIINYSLTQTLGRTLVTSLTTLLVLFTLLIFGGELIRNFAFALIVGVIVGTYSSIYVAANILLVLHIDHEDLQVPVKEGADAQNPLQKL